MKKIINKILDNILLDDLIFVSFNAILIFLLYLFNIRFRLWMIMFIILVSLVGFLIGTIQLIFKSSEFKKVLFISLSLNIVALIALVLVAMPILFFSTILNYRKEHVTLLDGKKYVAVVDSFLHVNVDYYDYYGPFLMGTESKVHGYFGKGGFDPFDNPNIIGEVEYTYFDKFGKTVSKKKVNFIKDKDGNIVDNYSYDLEDDSSNNIDENDKYLLPEYEEVLYEKSFDETILRFGKIDNTIGQKVLVNVLKSTDGGDNFYVVSEDALEVSDHSEYIFLNKNLGFIKSLDKIYLDDSKTCLYVTHDGGKTFAASKFKYENESVEYVSIKNLPYFEDNILKMECSITVINSSKDGYEEKELVFISNDEGTNWLVK